MSFLFFLILLHLHIIQPLHIIQAGLLRIKQLVQRRLAKARRQRTIRQRHIKQVTVLRQRLVRILLGLQRKVLLQTIRPIGIQVQIPVSLL